MDEPEPIYYEPSVLEFLARIEASIEALVAPLEAIAIDVQHLADKLTKDAS